MTKVRISIITPTYNVEEYIAEAIESVQKQSFRDYEHIIVDDGSTDKTASIVKKYAKTDPRIKLIKQKNSGAAAARNRGITEATGDYITFVDGDDFVIENMLKTLFNRAHDNDCDVVTFNKYLFNNSTKKVIEETWLYKTDSLPAVFSPRRDITNLTFLFAPLNICIFLNKKFITINNLLFDTNYRRNEDLIFVGKVMALADRASVVDEELYYYRVGISENMSSTLDRFMDDGWRAIDDLFVFLSKSGLLAPHVKQSFLILSCAILWHYIFNMKTYEAQKYALGKTKEIAERIGLQKMKDPGDIYTGVNFYKEMQVILAGNYDEYLWNRVQRDANHIKFLTEKIDSLDNALNEKGRRIDELTTQTKALSDAIDGIYRTLSWRVTKPLRGLRRAAGYIKKQIKRYI